MRVTLYKLKKKKKKEKEKGISPRKRRQLKVDELLVNRATLGDRDKQFYYDYTMSDVIEAGRQLTEYR